MALGAGLYYGAKAVKSYMDSRPLAKTMPANPPKKCFAYTPAPAPYAGVTYPSARHPQRSERTAAINETIALLQRGVSPGGFPIFGPGAPKQFDKNPLYFDGWTKYSVIYPARGFEVHYSLNEIACQYADVKATKPWDK